MFTPSPPTVHAGREEHSYVCMYLGNACVAFLADPLLFENVCTSVCTYVLTYVCTYIQVIRQTA